MRLRSPHWSFVQAALAMLVCGSFAAPVRADNIDKELLERAPELMKALQKQGYRNVGVLPFAVKKGKEAPSYHVGSLNTNMARRVENILILANDDKAPLSVIRDAAGVAAAADRKATFLTAAGREGLFKHSYPLFWGKEKVQADAFVTGVVDLSDLSKTAVALQVFDRKSAEPQALLSFKANTDRSILADSATSFVVSRGSLLKSRSPAQLEEEAVASAKQVLDEKKPISEQAGEKLVNLEIRYDDVAQDISKDSQSSAEEKVSPPNQGQKVTFYLTNSSKEKVGVVLKVNGESTLRSEQQDDCHCVKWVLEPGEKYALRGFYDDQQKKLWPFDVLSEEESARLQESAADKQRIGAITLTTFRETSTVKDDEMKFTARGLSQRQQKKAAAPATLAEAKTQVTRSLAATTSRGMLGKGSIGEESNLKEIDLKNPQQVETRVIRYYTPLK